MRASRRPAAAAKKAMDISSMMFSSDGEREAARSESDRPVDAATAEAQPRFAAQQSSVDQATQTAVEPSNGANDAAEPAAPASAAAGEPANMKPYLIQAAAQTALANLNMRPHPMNSRWNPALADTQPQVCRCRAHGASPHPAAPHAACRFLSLFLLPPPRRCRTTPTRPACMPPTARATISRPLHSPCRPARRSRPP